MVTCREILTESKVVLENILAKLNAGIKLMNSSGTVIDPATEGTLSSVKIQTDKFTFDTGRLKTFADGSIQLSNISDVTVNPATLESIENMSETLVNYMFPSYIKAGKPTGVGTGTSTITPTFLMTKINLANTGLTGLVFAIDADFGTNDIYLPPEGSLSISHAGAGFINYKSIEEGGEFIYVLQGSTTQV